MLKTDHFDIYFYPAEREGTDVSARLAERWLARLERLFDHTLRGRQPLVLYASHPDFEQTNVIPGDLGEGTGGVTEPLRRRIVLPLAGPIADTDHVIGHELVHAFQFDISESLRGPRGQGPEENPTWAPDGRAIAFTGMSQGLTDLYIYDLTTSVLRRLTNDAFADLQPARPPRSR